MHLLGQRFAMLSSIYLQLLDEVRLLVGDAHKRDSFSSFPSALLTTDNTTFEDHLKSRSAEISGAISKLFTPSTVSSAETSELRGRIAQLLANEKGHIIALEKSRLEQEQLLERLEAASLRYMIAEKKLDRAKSATVAKLEKQATSGGFNEAGSGLGGGVEQSGDGQNYSKAENGDAYFEAEVARKEAVAAFIKQKEQIELLEAENGQLNSQIRSLNIRLSHLSDDDFSRSDLFKHLKSQHEDVIKRINHLEATNIQLREEAEKLQKERVAYRVELENEAQRATAEKEALLTQAEHDLARVRAGRDELMADVAMRKAAQSQERVSVKQIKELLGEREERIKALESEVERLGVQCARRASPSSPESSTEDKLADDLQSKYSNLERQYSMLSSELQSMGKAYKKASAIASQKVESFVALEERMARLGAEKSKADQKYFAAMKAKETREQEIRSLRASSSKSSEMVSTLKDAESATRAALANLDKELTEMKTSHAAISSQHRTAQQQVSEQKIVSEALKSQVEELKKSLASKDSSASFISNANRKAEVEIEALKVRLEETKRSLESWKTKGLGNQSDEYEMLRVRLSSTRNQKNMTDWNMILTFFFPPGTDPSHLHRVPRQLQKHGHQDVRARFLQRLRRGTPQQPHAQVPQLQQSLWRKRPYACHALEAAAFAAFCKFPPKQKISHNVLFPPLGQSTRQGKAAFNPFSPLLFSISFLFFSFFSSCFFLATHQRVVLVGLSIRFHRLFRPVS